MVDGRIGTRGLHIERQCIAGIQDGAELGGTMLLNPAAKNIRIPRTSAIVHPLAQETPARELSIY